MKRLRGLIARSDGSNLPGTVSFGATIESIEASGQSDAHDYILPGFIDLQINGAGNVDVMSASSDALVNLSTELAREGTTAWLATAITSPLERIEACAATIAEAASIIESIPADGSRGGAAAILGMHQEGPFIAPSRLGAHPPCNLVPQGEALNRVAALRGLRIMTLAPELDGAMEAVTMLSAHGVAVSLGHTDATLEQAQAAVAAGARMFTHTFNAMAPMHHRKPTVAAAAMLPSRALAAVIPDGAHVHPEILRLLFRARGAWGVCLNSDRAATGCTARSSPLSGTTGSDGAVRTREGALVGSDISMLDGARMMVERAGASVGEAALMAATNPARVLGANNRGKIEVGARSDLLVLSPALELKAVFIGGRELT
jgi:N-acetylglucosamine-6-phosphate deacetylase